MSVSPASGCVYCGLPRARVRDRAERVLELVACRGHDDLLDIDPAFHFAGHLAAIAYPALELDRAPSGARRERSPFASQRPLAVPSEAG